MSRKQTIELEWFNIEDKEPDPLTPIITDWDYSYILVKEEDSGYYVKANDVDDFSITKSDFTEWAYYPF